MTIKKPRKGISMLLLASGVIFIAISIDYSDEIIALIGLTLLLWGVIITNSSQIKYIDTKIVTKSYNKINTLYEAIIHNRNFEGDPIYYSPNSFWGASNVRLFIGKKDNTKVHELRESEEFEITDDSLIIIPHGIALLELIEEELPTNIISMDSSNFNKNIKKAIVDQLEIAEDVDIKINEKDFDIIIIKSLLNENMENYTINNDTTKFIGDPLVSAIICLLAKKIHKPLIIENINYNASEYILRVKVKLL